MKGKAMSPLNMPRKRVRRESMAQRHAHCQDKANCTGPGCKASTGKTYRDTLPRREQ